MNEVETKFWLDLNGEGVQQEIGFHLILKKSHFILERWINST